MEYGEFRKFSKVDTNPASIWHFPPKILSLLSNIYRRHQRTFRFCKRAQFVSAGFSTLRFFKFSSLGVNSQANVYHKTRRKKFTFFPSISLVFFDVLICIFFSLPPETNLLVQGTEVMGVSRNQTLGSHPGADPTRATQEQAI